MILKNKRKYAIIYVVRSDNMKLTKKGYKERLIDKIIAENLKIFGANAFVYD